MKRFPHDYLNRTSFYTVLVLISLLIGASAAVERWINPERISATVVAPLWVVGLVFGWSIGIAVSAGYRRILPPVRKVNLSFFFLVSITPAGVHSLYEWMMSGTVVLSLLAVCAGSFFSIYLASLAFLHSRTRITGRLPRTS